MLLILLLLGIFFRCTNLEQKIYWGDEVYTSLNISGYTFSEMEQQLVGNGRIISSEDLQKYQYPNPEKSAVDTIRSVASDASKHMPLYFLSVRFWVQWLGNSVAVIRSFSAFFSLLALPCFYWLCRELFGSSTIGWVAVALMAVSPVHVVYAQEARPYSLWIVTILLSSIALLRAMKVKTKISWGIYAVTVTLGLYTYLFFVLVAIGQGIYVAVIERFRLTKNFISYLVVGCITSLPWLYVVLTQFNNLQAKSWPKQKLSDSAKRWAGIVSRTFVDLGVSPGDSLKSQIVLAPIILMVLALSIYSIYFLCRRTPKRIWLFILTLIGSVGLPLILLDFILGKRYGTTRYILPVSLGIQLSVAYLLTTKIFPLAANLKMQKLWSIVAAIIISSGVLSCVVRSQTEIWWNQLPDKYGHYPQIARIINQVNEPLLVSYHLFQTQILGHLLAPEVKLQLFNQSDIPKISHDFERVLLFDPSETAASKLEQVHQLRCKQIFTYLWELEN